MSQSNLVGASDGNRHRVTRRDALKTAAALPVALAAKPAWAQQSPIPVVDMHAHFFNAADLPIAGFVSHVFKQGSLGGSRAGRAAADFLGGLVKDIAASADEELAAIGGQREFDLTPDEFGARSADYVDRRLHELQRSGAAADRELAESYNELTATLAADAGYDASLVARSKSFAATPGISDDRAFQKQLNAYSFATVARKTVNPAIVNPGVVLERYAAPDVKSVLANPVFVLGKLSRLIGWAFLMGRTRRHHVREFLQAYSDSRAAPAMAVNHLVDYDYWLDDAPDASSTLLKQVGVFVQIAARFAGTINLRTFAGFCPLRHAIETLSRRPVLFEQFKPLAASGAISGFKLYPPMGFRPSNNAALDDREFDPQGRAPRTALDRWTAAGGGPGLGRALDASLTQFYNWCATKGAPIMAHASPGNEAGSGFGQRAHPNGWEAVATQFPIRLSLGHLVHEAEPFVRAVCDGPPYPLSVWSLQAPLRMLDPNNQPIRAKVYGDLGYMPELIDNRPLARKFFMAL